MIWQQAANNNKLCTWKSEWWSVYIINKWVDEDPLNKLLNTWVVDCGILRTKSYHRCSLRQSQDAGLCLLIHVSDAWWELVYYFVCAICIYQSGVYDFIICWKALFLWWCSWRWFSHLMSAVGQIFSLLTSSLGQFCASDFKFIILSF